MLHQLFHRWIVQVLIENFCTVLHCNAAQFRRRNRALILEVVIEAGGDGEISGQAGTLFQMGKIAGSEINAVQGKDKRQSVFTVAEVMTLGINFGRNRVLQR